MPAANQATSAREAQRAEANRAELAEHIARAMPTDGVAEPLPGLSLGRLSASQGKVFGVIKPSFCVIAQGSKEVLQGDSRYVYDPAHYLIATVDLPRASQVLEASPERPYLSLTLTLAPALVSSVLVEMEQGLPPGDVDARAMAVSPLDVELQDAVVRLIRLLDTPGEARVLMPLIMREIVYRLLLGNQGSRLSHLANVGGNATHIAKAVERLRQEFDRTLRMEQIANDLGMSLSGFHHHFKAVTGMSPLQFQKQVRLQEARRLMLGEHLDATSTAFRVGYDDASHFNREYKRLFGEPPARDVQRLRAATVQSSGLAAD
jgi:AraC-like DNA-binding protein